MRKMVHRLMVDLGKWESSPRKELWRNGTYGCNGRGEEHYCTRFPDKSQGLGTPRLVVPSHYDRGTSLNLPFFNSSQPGPESLASFCATRKAERDSYAPAFSVPARPEWLAIRQRRLKLGSIE